MIDNVAQQIALAFGQDQIVPAHRRDDPIGQPFELIARLLAARLPQGVAGGFGAGAARGSGAAGAVEQEGARDRVDIGCRELGGEMAPVVAALGLIERRHVEAQRQPPGERDGPFGGDQQRRVDKRGEAGNGG